MKRFYLLLFFVLFSLVAQHSAEQPEYIEQVYYSTDQALSKAFPNANSFELEAVSLSQEKINLIQQRLGRQINQSQIVIYNARKDSELLGYALILEELGKYYPITFLTSITSDFAVKEVVLMVYREKIGKSVRKNRFLKQFKQKRSDDPIMVDNDIIGVTGATLSSWAIAAGVKRALVLTEEISKTL